MHTKRVGGENMKKRMQFSLAILVTTFLFAVAISGSVSADELADNYLIDQCTSDLEDNGLSSIKCCDTDLTTVDPNSGKSERDEARDNSGIENKKSEREEWDNSDRENSRNNNRADRCCNYNTAKLGDRVWDDLNANGIQDPDEPGLAGVTVNLWTGTQFNPITKINTTVTNATGNYVFENLRAGIYWLEFIAPDSVVKWIFSPQNQGTDDSLDSDANAAGIAGPICLNRRECDDSWDAGLYKLAAVGNKVWDDINKNGIQDPNEPGVAGVTVNLWTGDATGPLVKTAYSTITDANGEYIFTNLVPGIYWLEFVLPNEISSWIFTLQNQGTDDSLDSDANATGWAGPIELISGEVDLTWDAGLDPGSAAGGDEEPVDGAAGGEEIIEEPFEEVAAAGEETVALQETGIPVALLVMAILMILAGSALPKRK